jgi:hypothetical protein
MLKETHVTQATDRDQIVTVLTHYATGIDRRDWPLLESCFADDFTSDYGEFGAWDSRDGIMKFMIESHDPMGPTLHRLSNFVVTVTENTARAQTYVHAILTPGAAGGAVRQAFGWYDDTLVRSSEGWKLQRRRFTPVHVE